MLDSPDGKQIENFSEASSALDFSEKDILDVHH